MPSALKVTCVHPLLKKPSLDRDMLCNYRPVSTLSLSSIQDYLKGSGSAIVWSYWFTKPEWTIPVSISQTTFNRNHIAESATISRRPWIVKKVLCLWYLTWVQLSTQLTTPYYSISSASVMVFRVMPYGGLHPICWTAKRGLWLVRLQQKTTRVTQECRRDPCWGQHCSHCMSNQSAMSSEDTASISPLRWRPAIDAYFWSESYIIIQSHTASSRLHNRNSGVAHRKLSQSDWSENWVPSDCACICKEIN